MKIRGLIIAACILLVLSGLLYWSNRHNPQESTKLSADTPPAILKLDEGSINKVELKKKDTPPILLAKADSGASTPSGSSRKRLQI